MNLIDMRRNCTSGIHWFGSRLEGRVLAGLSWRGLSFVPGGPGERKEVFHWAYFRFTW
ncbi:hypothetical protein Btus_0499 [Kyrpidia tusciae DSM 2912]|uniref:Uncharacterized protein n=1 Tax=Kyrpidia tusciae (strain DSM 2912 / NBRC 15312 / T2) TaxID=562970 RepID=D5WTU7_KYRT2|nr:hypothetical protein Btus_0499 [Kyrpidia tusciae DSM 2912]